MFLHHFDLTTALRPSYLPDEDLLYVQDNVGLYEGKYKLECHQNGQVYLTSHRICYVDKADPINFSLAIDLKDVERYEFYAGFLKSSAKITLIPKPTKRSPIQSRLSTASPARIGNGFAPQRPYRMSPHPGGGREAAALASATWVCTICSFSNPVPSNFDPESLNSHTPLPPCLACGIQPTMTHVLKAVISSASNRPPLGTSGLQRSQSNSNGNTAGDNTTPPPAKPAGGDLDPSFPCPRCTFSNYPSLMSCEMCGAALVSEDLPAQLALSQPFRTESPGPEVVASFSAQSGVDNPESVKLSFRGGGEKVFYERLKGSIAQRKWLLQNAPPVPNAHQGTMGLNGTDVPGTGAAGTETASGERTRTVKAAGIAGLEKRGMDMRKNTELVIGSAFEDLEALMASAKQVVALAERLARQTAGLSADASNSNNNLVLAESASQLGLVTTKDIVGGGGSGRESLYLSELARNLAEFLTDEARGVLRREGGIISLVDLWAVFNRARGGVELVSPSDMRKAAQLWEKLRLPVRLRTFKSGVMVVQSRDRTDEATVKAIIGWLRDLRAAAPADKEVPWHVQEFGRGVSAQEVAQQFGWSIGVTEEELEMAEERGMLCREEGLSGLLFWENFIDTGERRKSRPDRLSKSELQVHAALRDLGFI